MSGNTKKPSLKSKKKVKVDGTTRLISGLVKAGYKESMLDPTRNRRIITMQPAQMVEELVSVYGLKTELNRAIDLIQEKVKKVVGGRLDNESNFQNEQSSAQLNEQPSAQLNEQPSARVTLQHRVKRDDLSASLTLPQQSSSSTLNNTQHISYTSNDNNTRLSKYDNTSSQNHPTSVNKYNFSSTRSNKTLNNNDNDTLKEYTVSNDNDTRESNIDNENIDNDTRENVDSSLEVIDVDVQNSKKNFTMTGHLINDTQLYEHSITSIDLETNITVSLYFVISRIYQDCLVLLNYLQQFPQPQFASDNNSYEPVKLYIHILQVFVLLSTVHGDVSCKDLNNIIYKNAFCVQVINFHRQLMEWNSGTKASSNNDINNLCKNTWARLIAECTNGTDVKSLNNSNYIKLKVLNNMINSVLNDNQSAPLSITDIKADDNITGLMMYYFALFKSDNNYNNQNNKYDYRAQDGFVSADTVLGHNPNDVISKIKTYINSILNRIDELVIKKINECTTNALNTELISLEDTLKLRDINKFLPQLNVVGSGETLTKNQIDTILDSINCNGLKYKGGRSDNSSDDDNSSSSDDNSSNSSDSSDSSSEDSSSNSSDSSSDDSSSDSSDSSSDNDNNSNSSSNNNNYNNFNNSNNLSYQDKLIVSGGGEKKSSKHSKKYGGTLNTDSFAQSSQQNQQQQMQQQMQQQQMQQRQQNQQNNMQVPVQSIFHSSSPFTHQPPSQSAIQSNAMPAPYTFISRTNNTNLPVQTHHAVSSQQQVAQSNHFALPVQTHHAVSSQHQPTQSQHNANLPAQSRNVAASQQQVAQPQHNANLPAQSRNAVASQQQVAQPQNALPVQQQPAQIQNNRNLTMPGIMAMQRAHIPNNIANNNGAPAPAAAPAVAPRVNPAPAAAQVPIGLAAAPAAAPAPGALIANKVVQKADTSLPDRADQNAVNTLLRDALGLKYGLPRYNVVDLTIRDVNYIDKQIAIERQLLIDKIRRLSSPISRTEVIELERARAKLNALDSLSFMNISNVDKYQILERINQYDSLNDIDEIRYARMMRDIINKKTVEPITSINPSTPEEKLGKLYKSLNEYIIRSDVKIKVKPIGSKPQLSSSIIKKIINIKCNCGELPTQSKDANCGGTVGAHVLLLEKIIKPYLIKLEKYYTSITINLYKIHSSLS